jgi:hypothetical protein
MLPRYSEGWLLVSTRLALSSTAVARNPWIALAQTIRWQGIPQGFFQIVIRGAYRFLVFVIFQSHRAAGDLKMPDTHESSVSHLFGKESTMLELEPQLTDSEKEMDCLSPTSKRFLEKNDAAFIKPTEEGQFSSSSLVIQRPASSVFDANGFNFGKPTQSTLQFSRRVNPPSISGPKTTIGPNMRQRQQKYFLPLTSIGSR